MFVNNPERLAASLLTSTVLTMTLLSSGVNADDEPFDFSLFEAEASGTSVAVAAVSMGMGLGRVQLSVYPSFCLKGLMHDE